ncbi:MAG: PKD domain-containing protein [Cyclobacteriaceae bacterium]
MKNVFSILLVVLIAWSAGCSEEETVTPTPEPEPEPEIIEVSAGFTADSTVIEVGKSVTFDDNSTGSPTAWSWTFEGGEPATSTQQNPVVSYSAPGTYDVTLKVSNATSEDTLTKSEMITVEVTPEEEEEEEGEGIALEAQFTFDAIAIQPGGSVQFTDASTGNPTSWSWDFAGGTPATSSDQNPTITYDTPGVFGVSLTVSNGDTDHTLSSDSLIVVVEEEEVVENDFDLAGMWLLESNSTDVLEESVVLFDPETQQATLIELWMNTHCFEFGDIVWKDVTPTADGFTLQEMYRNCVTHLYADSEITIVDENTIRMTGNFQGEPFSRTWTRYECKEEHDLDTYLNGTWEEVDGAPNKLLIGLQITADLSEGQGVVVDDANNPICWEVGDVAWDEIEATNACGVYSVQGLVKDCTTEERQNYYIRIIHENRFVLQDKYGGTQAFFERVVEES